MKSQMSAEPKATDFKVGTQFTWGHIAEDHVTVMRHCPNPTCEKQNDVYYSLKAKCAYCGYALKPKDFYSIKD